MDFKKKMKLRLNIAISYLVLGAALTVIAFVSKTDNDFLTPFGIALMVMGVMRIIQHRKVTQNPDTLRQRELAETDERNRMIAERAKSWAFSFSLLLAGVTVIVLSLLDYHDLAQPFAWFVCLMTVLYWIFYHIAKRKY